MDFINGKADPWGMKVNPAYKKIKLPRAGVAAARQLRPEDRATPAGRTTRDVYFTQLAAPVTTLRKIAEALLDALAQRADPVRLRPSATDTYKLGRVDRQASARASCSASSASATRPATGSAPPRSRPRRARTSRRPTRSLAAAREARPTQKKKYEPFVLDQADVRKSRTAYPGTMVVYTAAGCRTWTRTTPPRSRSSSGSRRPRASARAAATASCPSGFLPIRRQGVTAQAATPRPRRSPTPSRRRRDADRASRADGADRVRRCRADTGRSRRRRPAGRRARRAPTRRRAPSAVRDAVGAAEAVADAGDPGGRLRHRRRAAARLLILLGLARLRWPPA